MMMEKVGDGTGVRGNLFFWLIIVCGVLVKNYLSF